MLLSQRIPMCKSQDAVGGICISIWADAVEKLLLQITCSAGYVDRFRPQHLGIYNQQNKKAFIQSRQPREAGVVVQERRSCPVSSARPVLVVATRAATRCL